MTRMLFSGSTPSILDSSWLTTVSWTPEPPPTEPLCLQMASISSNMMMWRPLLLPILFCSSSASSNNFLMLDSDSPTNLFRISGPLTTLGSLAESILPICLAVRVLPHPGGPYNSIPLIKLLKYIGQIVCYSPILFLEF